MKKRARTRTRLPLAGRFKRIVEEARRYFRAARGSHDWGHTERVLQLCLRIGQKERADLDVLRLAAVLHDIGRAHEDRSNGRVSHSDAGAAMARRILARHDVPVEKAEHVIECIRTHRFRKGGTPATIEAMILFDADKLDSIGAVGVGRAFLFAGEVGARLHNRDIDIRRTQPYTKEDTAYREYLVKLRWIKGRMFTRGGKRIAAERHRFMVEFFKRLNKEVVGLL